MKLFVILSTFVVISLRICSTASINENVVVISSYNEISENSYRFGYVLSDGQIRHEEGKLLQVGDKQVLTVTGSYSFIGDDGKKYTVQYIADEHGYRKTKEIIKMIPKPAYNPHRNQNKINNREKIMINSIDPNLSKTLLSG